MSNSNGRSPQGWHLARFDEFLKRVERKIILDDSAAYSCVGVRWYGMGAFVRETLSGLEINRKQQWIIKAGDIVYNKLFAWKNAFAIADDLVDGCIVSDKFPTYEADTTILDPRFLAYYFRMPQLAQQAQDLSKGAAAISKLTLNPPQFWELTIPLPPLDEQQRIVARIDALAARIEEARGLRREAAEEVENLMAPEEIRIWPDEKLEGAASLEEVTVYLSRGRQSTQGESEHYLIKTQHVQMGKYVKTNITLAPEVASKVSSEAIARQGDILIACSAAGCLGRVACYTDADRVASTDTHVAIARANPQIILPEYLYAYLKGAQGQKQLRSREQGDWTKEKVGFRLAELNLADLKQVPVPLPSLDEQRRIVAYLDELQAKADALKRLQAEATAELEALLPAVLDQAFRGEL